MRLASGARQCPDLSCCDRANQGIDIPRSPEVHAEFVRTRNPHEFRDETNITTNEPMHGFGVDRGG